MLKFLGVLQFFVSVSSINSSGQKQREFKGIEFNVKKIPPDLPYLPADRIEHAERNTSKAYDYWKQMDINFIEWPGNITKLELEYPLVKWTKKNAKLINCPCNIALGMDFKAYAYKYLHLTWGKFRLTTSYCPPLKIPRRILQDKLSSTSSKSAYIAAIDFEFVSDALLIILDSKVIVSVGKLESAHLSEGSTSIPDRSSLVYSRAKGISTPVTKLVVQNCCKNRLTKTCVHGETVLAFNERSREPIIFISIDSGGTFRQITLTPMLSLYLHSVLLFPRFDTIVALHGDETSLEISHYYLSSGKIKKSHQEPYTTERIVLSIQEIVQAKQFGEESSMIIWDECRVWYSNDTGLTISEALFYIHENIQKDIDKKLPEKKRDQKKHKILQKHCYLGGTSQFTFDPAAGKVGILDSHNNFFYGIDTKSSQFNLIGANMDMSLLLTGKESSIVPYFDFNNRPKLMYPPKYLWSDDIAYTDKNYKKRLGIRLFPRSIFPSDFMPPFYDENIPKRYKNVYGLKKCETSSIVADSSLSQKPKIFHTKENSIFNFTIEFKSFKNHTDQLHVEPALLRKFLSVDMILLDFIRLGVKEYWYFKYNVSVRPKPIAFAGNFYRLNFFTMKSVRCVHQPQLTVWVKIESAEFQEDTSPQNTFTTDPEPVKMLRNFLNSSSIRKIKHDKNPTSINQCSSKS